MIGDDRRVILDALDAEITERIEARRKELQSVMLLSGTASEALELGRALGAVEGLEAFKRRIRELMGT